MPAPQAHEREFEPPRRPRFSILAIDGGGIRGLIPALVIERLERLLGERRPGATLAGSFDLIAGTSTGGLIALGLAMPGEGGRPAMGAGEIVELYGGDEAREVFAGSRLRRLPVIRTLAGLLGPRYGLDGLRMVLERRFGDAMLADALTAVLVPSYDMSEREPRFLKPWLAEASRISAVEAGLATSAAPTYFPALQLGESALIDGGVFANNPTVAAIVEAMKRREGEPLSPADLLVVSLGTGHYEVGYAAERVKRWGSLGWILPGREGEPPLIGAMLDGHSDAADHWAHVLLNHEPGAPMERGARIGAGPRYFRWQIDLPESLPLDGVTPPELARLRECGEALREARSAEIAAVADALTAPPG